MSNKVGLILSMFFLINILLFGTDVLSYQMAISKANMVSVNARTQLQYTRSLALTKDYVEHALKNSTFACTTGCEDFAVGKLTYFEITQTYKPLTKNILGYQKTIKVTRSIIWAN